MNKVRFLPEAEEELLQQVAHYSDARPGLGIRFQAAVEATVARALAHPDSGAPSRVGTRRLLIKDFPFSVFYRAGPGELLVVAISHHKRHPQYWAGRARR